MFPFNSHHFILESDLTDSQFRSRLEIGKSSETLSKKRAGWILETTRKPNTVILEYKQGYFRNSFRPLIVCSWYEFQGKIILNSYLRLPWYVILFNLTPVIFGIYISIKISNFQPLLFTLLLSVMLHLIGYIFFKMDQKWIVNEFKKLVSK